MSDGCRLAAKIWLPENAESEPVPALLEYIPYRRGDGTAVGDSTRHAYFAGHGYASVRVDLRGSGDSDGVLLDEYLPQEQDDAVEVHAWLAAQPWCTGATGMFGISWGGFNSLQVAARRPPSLKAIVTICSTDDRYADDVHYMGGCLLGVEALSWAATMLAFNARPPDPAAVGERWRELWLERLDGSPPFIEAWLSHQLRDSYWKQGSVCEDYSAIECAVYAVGGWADPYRNTVLRLLEGLPGPRKGLIGPWSHNYPEDGVPGPAIGFLQEALRWWDHWLKGIDAGIMDEPMLRAWMQESAPPAAFYAERPGRWVAEPSWPAEREQRSIPLELPAAELLGAQEHGLLAGDWCPYGGPEELPRPAGRGRALALLHLGPARGAARAAGLPGGRAHPRRRPPAGPRLRTPLRHRAGRRFHPRHPRPAQPHPPRRSRAACPARPGRALHGPRAPERNRARVPGRPPRPGRRLADLLAVGLALSGGGHPDRARGAARAAGPPTPARGRGARSLRPSRGSGGDRDRGSAREGERLHDRSRCGDGTLRAHVRPGLRRAAATSERDRVGDHRRRRVRDRGGRPALGRHALRPLHHRRPRRLERPGGDVERPVRGRGLVPRHERGRGVRG